MERLWIPSDSYIFSFGGLLLGGAVGIATRQLIEEKCIVYMHYVAEFYFRLLSLEIIPETFSSYEMIGPILGIAIGILIMSLLDNYCHHPMIHKKSTGMANLPFSLFAIFIHNIPSGFALGTALLIMLTLPYLLIAIVVHHIPEGLALIIPFLFTKHKYISFLLTTLLLFSYSRYRYGFWYFNGRKSASFTRTSLWECYRFPWLCYNS